MESVPNPLGVVPVVPLTNSGRLLDHDGRSEIEDLKPLVDGLTKTLADLDDDGNPVADPETGEPVMDTVNPIPEGNRAMISEAPEAKFGQLPGADLAGFKTSVDIWVQMIMAVSALPAHMIGISTSNPATAEAIRAAEAGLTAKVIARQLTFGRAWEQVARLMVAVRSGVDPTGVTIRVVWADASTRSTAAEADAAVKLFQAGILSRRTTLARMGFSEDEITAELNQAEFDARIGADIRLGRYVSDLIATA